MHDCEYACPLDTFFVSVHVCAPVSECCARARARVCVCVCERERASDRERNKVREYGVLCGINDKQTPATASSSRQAVKERIVPLLNSRLLPYKSRCRC